MPTDPDDLALDDLDLDPAEEAAPPDPLVLLAGRLDDPAVTEEVAALDRQGLVELATLAVNLARSAPDPSWLPRLEALRRALMARNERPAYALVLAGQADVAADIGDFPLQVRFLDKLLGARDLLAEPWKAQAVCLDLARAQERAGDAAAAEATLHRAVERGRKLAPGGNLVPASARVSAALVQLGQLLARRGRTDEARAWLEGAVETAPDPDSRAAAEAALVALD